MQTIADAIVDSAKKDWLKADKMSKGRLFQNPAHIEYLKFYKEKNKDHGTK